MRIVRFVTIAIIFWCLPGLLSAQKPGVQQRPYDTARLDSLSITVLDVFDSTEALSRYSFARLANFIHINTSDYIILRELLFLKDSLVTETRIGESANNLRELGIFQHVSIEPNPAYDSASHMDVHVKDQFTLELRTSLRREGGDYKGLIGFEEKNFLGRGYRFMATYSNRESRSASEVQFTNPRLFNSRFRQKLLYRDYDEGTYHLAGIAKKFFSMETSWDAGGEYSRFDGVQNIYRKDDIVASGDHRNTMFESYYGKYFGSDVRFRMGALFRYRDETWSNPFGSGASSAWNSRTAAVLFGAIIRDLDVKQGVDFYDIDEDVHTGMLFNAGFGLDDKAWGANKRRKFYFFRGVFARALSPHENVFTEFHQERYTCPDAAERITNVVLSAFSKRFRYHTPVLRASFRAFDSPRPFELLYLGEEEGTRGYTTRSFRGNRRILLNIEDRFFGSREYFLFRFGGVVFFDLGTAWDSETVSLQDTNWHSSAGFGLRISSAKIPKMILRLDFAFNMENRKFSSVSFSKGHYFSVVYPIRFGVPTLNRFVAY